MKNRIGIPFERIYSSIERGTRECGPGGALMVHVGECRERNHTGKDDSEGGRVTEGRRGTAPRPAHPDFLETENWIVACGSRADLDRLIHVTDVSL